MTLRDGQLAPLDRNLADIKRAGWFVNNLFQRQDGSWQANLRREGGEGQDFGYGAAPEAALRACIDKMGGLTAPVSPEDLL